jgi:hypothetical protein
MPEPPLMIVDDDKSPTGWWISPYHFGIDQGPVI